MEFKKMPIKLFIKKLIGVSDSRDEQKFNNQVATNPRLLEEYHLLQKIWQEAGNIKPFEQIDSDADWKFITGKIKHSIPVKYHRIPFSRYFLRIAALLLLTFGLSFGIYRIIVTFNNTKSGFITQVADNQVKDIILPDGSSVALNSGSRLSYRDGFGTQSREVILEGEALFNVIHDVSLPFKVFVGESVVEVTGTSFSIREIGDKINIAVISGTVLFSSTNSNEKKISITANHTGYLLSNNEIKVEAGVSENVLSWKTGHLIFNQTPIDSALIDIAHHFRKDLSFETSLKEKITAEFQNQPLFEILDELKLVAGLQFDTTGTALIVRK